MMRAVRTCSLVVGPMRTVAAPSLALQRWYSTPPSMADQVQALRRDVDALRTAVQGGSSGGNNKDGNKRSWQERYLPPLQAAFFSMTVAGIVANLFMAEHREKKAQHVAAIKLSFNVMTDSTVMTLRRLVTGQPCTGYFLHRAPPVPALGLYRGSGPDLRPIDVVLALRKRGTQPNSTSVWSRLLPARPSFLHPSQDFVREQLGHFDHLITTDTMDLDMVPTEMKTLLLMLGGVGKFAPRNDREEVFLAALHDFARRRNEAVPFVRLLTALVPDWKPVEWTARHDDIALALAQAKETDLADH